MNLMPVDPYTYQGIDQLVEGYSSLIWTERFGVPGEFELKSPRVREVRSQLTEGLMVCIAESDTVMMVETLSDSTNDDDISEVTVKGRTLDAFLENRSIIGEYGIPWSYRQGEITVQDALLIYLWNSIVNAEGIDGTRDDSWPRDANDVLPNVVITDSIENFLPSSGTTPPEVWDLQTIQEWWLQSGQVSKQVQDFLNLGKLGLRIVRPRAGEPQSSDLFALPGVFESHSWDVAYARTPTTGFSALRFDVYNAKNRTTTPTPGDYYYYPIIVRYDAGHMDSTSTVSSIKDWRNIAHVSSSLGDEIDVIDDPAKFPTPPTGWDRRHMYVDAGTIDDSVVSYDVALVQKGLEALRAANKVTIVDGELSSTVPYSYPSDFALGTFITMVGKYGEYQDLQITEWIRTEDQSGERAYPGLVIKE